MALKACAGRFGGDGSEAGLTARLAGRRLGGDRCVDKPYKGGLELGIGKCCGYVPGLKVGACDGSLRIAKARCGLQKRSFYLTGHVATSPQIATPVLATIEAYMFLGFSRARFRKQSLVTIGGHSYDAMDYTRDPCPGRATMHFVIDMMFARDPKLATGATLITDDQIPD